MVQFSLSIQWRGTGENLSMEERKDILFMNISYYDIRHIVKDLSDSERKPAAAITWATHFDKQDSTYHSIC